MKSSSVAPDVSNVNTALQSSKYSSIKERSLRQSNMEIKPVKLLSPIMAFIKLASADWLTLNDSNVVNAQQNFNDENTNLSLVCALLFTTFLPIFYNEASTINTPGQGLALDIELSYISSKNIQYFSYSAIHDIILFVYCMAMGNTVLGTLCSVFFTLSATECQTNEKVMVLLKTLGWFATLPFYFFSVGILSWAFGSFFKIVLTSQTLPGLLITFLISSFVSLLLLIAAIKNIQGLYLSYDEEKNYSPTYLTSEEINGAIISYFQDFQSKNISLDDFISSITMTTLSGYAVPLHSITKMNVKRRFYEEIAKLSDSKFEDVLSLIE